MTPSVVLVNAACVLGMMVALWLISVRLSDVSIVDPWWSMGFLLVTTRTTLIAGAQTRNSVLLLMVAAWSIRLWLHLLRRSRGKPEDPRYAAFRARFGPERYWWISFFQVFLLQGLLIVVISAPLQLGALSRSNTLGWVQIAGIAVFLCGFAWEAAADAQLQKFRNNPSNRGKVMDRGLWHYSRHPNYFGEALLWWGLWIYVLDQPSGWATAFGPALMTFLLLRVSGVTLLDEHMRKTKPQYGDYVRRTSSFVPWPPHREPGKPL
jgi:steroid 5-alpha reductase family enzyme